MPKQVTFNREAILDLLIPLFIEKGYNGASMQDIVNITNLNRSSIYNSFGDKQSLFMTVLEKYARRQLRIKDEILTLDSDICLALKKFFQSLFLKHSDHDGVNGCLLTNCSLELGQSDKSVQNLILNSKDLMITNFEKILKAGIENGSVKKNTDIKKFAIILYNTLQGLRVLNGTNPDIENTEIIINSLFEKG